MEPIAGKADGTYALLAELPLEIGSWSVQPLSRQMTPERERRTMVVRLAGAGHEGAGEDITPIESEQLASTDAAPTDALAGQWTIDSFSAHLATLNLLAAPAQYERLRALRRWAFEAAALDLALAQAGSSLARALKRTSRPLTFVNSVHLADPPAFEPIRRRLELCPGVRFKLDATSEWDESLIAEIAATGAVDTIDLKGVYPPPFGQPADARLYERVTRAFPDAWIEDPAITAETESVLEPHRERITWDAALWSLADLEGLPTRPQAINVKPARFGSLRTLLDVYDHCEDNGIAMYGGGFAELGPGRDQIQYLASLFHPDTPNDVAPAGYNDEPPAPGLPLSPLTLTPAAIGFRIA